MNNLDLFSGIGAFSLGLERAGISTVAFCEINKYCRNILRKNWSTIPIYEDVKNVTAEKLKADGISVDIISGGFPCQDISPAGSGAGLEGERSGLWSEFYRIIREVEPKFVIIENVNTLRSNGLVTILQNINSVGYDAEWHVIPASSVGAFHRRERLWIIAHSKCVRLQGPWKFEPSVYQKKGRYREADRLIDDFRKGSLPFVCRGHNGDAVRLDQEAVMALGNSLDPFIPELIGKSIIERMNKST